MLKKLTIETTVAPDRILTQFFILAITRTTATVLSMDKIAPHHPGWILSPAISWVGRVTFFGDVQSVGRVGGEWVWWGQHTLGESVLLCQEIFWPARPILDFSTQH